MVARVSCGKSILGILNYNEHKVKQGKAECIHENLFGELQALTFSSKLKIFRNFLLRNQRATSTAVHISLNFHKSEELNKNQLADIASMYMERIGFGDQPFLVYQHFDAAHPHIHIVTTNIRKNGKRIVMYNIGKNQSEIARTEIEKTFHLVPATGRKTDHSLHPVEVTKALYGKSETKRSISNIVRHVTRHYRYASLPELNAALRQFNVVADRGKEGTRMFEKRGLVYSLLDEKGNKAGIPVKASAIYEKPTLAFLETRFKLNEALRSPHKDQLRGKIDHALNKRGVASDPEQKFTDALARQNVFVLFRQNENGIIYGITFVDNALKTVFNGSDLGKDYGLKAILEKLSMSRHKEPGSIQSAATVDAPDQSDRPLTKVIDDLTTAHQGFITPSMAKKQKKKKRKKGRSI